VDDEFGEFVGFVPSPGMVAMAENARGYDLFHLSGDTLRSTELDKRCSDGADCAAMDAVKCAARFADCPLACAPFSPHGCGPEVGNAITQRFNPVDGTLTLEGDADAFLYQHALSTIVFNSKKTRPALAVSFCNLFSALCATSTCGGIACVWGVWRVCHMHAAACCCVLVRAAACCCVLLRAAACCNDYCCCCRLCSVHIYSAHHCTTTTHW
jgi:hypothetical protein